METKAAVVERIHSKYLEVSHQSNAVVIAIIQAYEAGQQSMQQGVKSPRSKVVDVAEAQRTVTMYDSGPDTLLIEIAEPGSSACKALDFDKNSLDNIPVLVATLCAERLDVGVAVMELLAQYHTNTIVWDNE